jgi:hypothetical protein
MASMTVGNPIYLIQRYEEMQIDLFRQKFCQAPIVFLILKKIKLENPAAWHSEPLSSL